MNTLILRKRDATADSVWQNDADRYCRSLRIVTTNQFLNEIAEQLVHELTPTSRIKRFTTNPDIIGAYAEAAVRRWVSRFVTPLRVCTGAVISPELCSQPAKVRQIDTIIWEPSPCTAIFECGEFALVPHGSCYAVMEIKRSMYNGIANDLKERLSIDAISQCVSPTILGNAAWRTSGPFLGALAVVCIREKPQRVGALEEMIKEKKVVVLLEERNGDFVPNPRGVFVLVNFLAEVRQLAKDAGPYDLINLDAIVG